MKVLVCGSRSWDDYVTIAQRLAQFPRGTEIMHGGAGGADSYAGRAARVLGHTETVFPADWRGKGRSAGYIRNLEMLDEAPELVLAFWDGESKGTMHTVSEAKKRGIPVELFMLSEDGIVRIS